MASDVFSPDDLALRPMFVVLIPTPLFAVFFVAPGRQLWNKHANINQANLWGGMGRRPRGPEGY